MKKELYTFTFGVGQPNAGGCVQILSPSYQRAREKMMKLYGTAWAFSYDASTWEKAKENLQKHGIRHEQPICDTIVLPDEDVDICQLCQHKIDECEAKDANVTYGYGIYSDNVIQCDFHLPRETGVTE